MANFVPKIEPLRQEKLYKARVAIEIIAASLDVYPYSLAFSI